ncbi:MAG: elongation factor G [Chitinispirillaceae bacterium]|nr:elongation factor G [Chitinispirillaceae bacterium]
MKSYRPDSIRNLCLLSHGGVGKTTLLEAICFTAKSTSKMGKVENGSSNFDTRPDEKERKMTLSTHVGYCEWKDNKINILDTPGCLDFLCDARAAIRVVESAILLVDAVDGIQVGTELVSSFLDKVKISRMFFVNSCDKENANFDKVLTQLKETYGSGVAPIVIPIQEGVNFKGVVDVISKEAYEYTKGGDGIGKKIALSSELSNKIDGIRQQLIEAVAETDEELMNSYFEKGSLSDEELKKGLAKGIKEGGVFPVFCGSAVHNIGIDLLLSNIVTFSPSAAERKEIIVKDKDGEKKIECTENAPTTAFVFKTLSEEHVGEINIVRVFAGKLKAGADMYNSVTGSIERLGNMFYLKGKERIDASDIPVGDIGGLLKLKDTHTDNTIVDKGATHFFPPTELPEPLVSVAIYAKDKGDEDKIATGFAKLHEEDRSFTYKYHPDIHQSILSAMGDIQIDVILENLKNRFKVEVIRKPPKISYRETITKTVKYVEYTHKKQSGGAGQYARVFIDVEPLPRGGGYEFVDKIVGGVIDQPFRPSVDKGIQSKMAEGILAGYPIVDIRVSLVDGKTHPVDSKDIAFQIAGREAFKKAFEMASPILLEPIVDLTITVPDEYTGDIMGDMSSRRGKITGMNSNGKYQVITAKVPEAEVMSYSTTLRSLTQGRGFYTKAFSHYEPVPAEIAKKIIEQAKTENKEE